MTIKPYHNQITTSATTTVLSSTCLLAQVIISCSVAGTTWKLRIQDKNVPPFVIVPDFTLSLPADGKPYVLTFKDFQPQMIGGISIVTTGTPGTVDVWLHVGAGP